MDSLSLLLVPKNRKVEFEVEVFIQELANVPLVTGLYYVKLKLKNGEKSNSMTSRAPIKDHSIFWNYKLENFVQIVIGKDGVLMPCELNLKIKQELNGGKEINNIGKLSLNLSEYVGLNAMTRRYLLQDSKINSTLKLTINMKQTIVNSSSYKVDRHITHKQPMLLLSLHRWWRILFFVRLETSHLRMWLKKFLWEQL
ncbi:uncharacterized protein OCT59_006489 [Rhizophagus irregularis]|uniref:uncharacterized protein n=1 Tax=Rhizophagus irregularis TaxID=588596 RepID=UPI0033298698|nr:hypothetical protein OCT59_006489 [Rhizophagus irregularis]